ncbi:hypothetical protein JCM11491_003820 [Sporobolomyces phaffii]
MSTFGTMFRVTTYGESHCASVGAIIDGCPPGMPLSNEDIQPQMTRRRPGQSNLTTPRNEADQVYLQSGIEAGVTLGTPIGLLVRNKDQRPHDYTETDHYPRPSHADWTYLLKYGLKASSGGGRSSARETIGRVAAGTIAERYLKLAYGVEIVAFVSSVGKVHMPESSTDSDLLSEDYLKLLHGLTREKVDENMIRCPHQETADAMEERIMEAKANNDSIGGTVTCVIRRSPVGLGEPVFDKLEATLAHAMLSIPATKGFEIGSGFKGTEAAGSVHNDAFVKKEDGSLGTKTNRSGGVQGGISNGEDIYFKVAFKSPATISQEQTTAKYNGESGVLATRGRHDPCVVPRAVPIVEAMAALVIMDAVLIQNSRAASAALLPPLATPLPPSMSLPPKKEMEQAVDEIVNPAPMDLDSPEPRPETQAGLLSLPSELLDSIFDLAHSIDHRLTGPPSKTLVPSFHRTVYREILVESYDALARLCATARIHPELLSHTRRLDIQIPMREPEYGTPWEEVPPEQAPDEGSIKYLFECLTRLEELEIGGSFRLVEILLMRPNRTYPFTSTLVALDLTSTFTGAAWSSPFGCLARRDPSINDVYTELAKLSIDARGDFGIHLAPPSTRPNQMLVLPKLEELSLTGPVSFPWFTPPMLREYGNLTSLALNETGKLSLLMERLSYVANPSRIRHLELWLSNDDAEPGFDERPISQLAAFTNLDSLVVQGPWVDTTPEFYDTLVSLAPLAHLSFKIDTDVSTDQLARLISSTSAGPGVNQIKRITLDNVDSVRGDTIPRDQGAAAVREVDLIGLGWNLANWSPEFSPRGLRELVQAAKREGVVVDGYAVDSLAVEDAWTEEVRFYNSVVPGDQ